MKSYVLGFLFSGSDFYGSGVALIHKKRPKWQEGKLNGIGGAIEEGETPEAAMRREFFQETAYDHGDWKRFALLNSMGNVVHCFVGRASGSVDISSPTDEETSWISISRIFELQLSISFGKHFIYNIGWLVSMAFDHLNNGNFYEVTENLNFVQGPS